MKTKQRILMAAEEIMAEKGLKATISSIASKSGIKDSVIYHYFKNKEELLFSIAESRLLDIREKMEEQLLGLEDPVSRLRKLIFFRLYYLDKHRNYGKLLLFECRSNMNFFRHTAFAQARWFMATLGQIIEHGMDTGVFRKDLNVWLVRDAVFGIMDLTTMDRLRSPVSSHEKDFDWVMDLVFPMVKTPEEAAPRPKDRRASILAAAEIVFAGKGYDNASIQDIAQAAGVGDGTVYDYFQNKEDLLFKTIMEGFRPSNLKKGFQDHLDVTDSCGSSNTIKNLERFIRRHFLISLTQPAFAKIFILHGIYNKIFYSSDAGRSVSEYLARLTSIVSRGMAEGIIRPSVEPETFERLVMGAFSHMTLRWLISEKKASLDKVGEINSMVDMIIRSIREPSGLGKNVLSQNASLALHHS